MTTVWVRGEDYTAESSWGLLDWCRRRGADEFGLAVLGPPYVQGSAWTEVDALLAPFRRRQASGGDRWALTGESAAVLRELLPDGLLGAAAAERLRDPAVYRGGEALLRVESASGEGVLSLRGDDAASLARAGLPHHGERRGRVGG
jgi:hypothetical protein